LAEIGRESTNVVGDDAIVRLRDELTRGGSLQQQ